MREPPRIRVARKSVSCRPRRQFEADRVVRSRLVRARTVSQVVQQDCFDC